jgi:K+-transporting ATPase ATPase C chain
VPARTSSIAPLPSRPSAQDRVDAANSSGSNLGPTSRKLRSAIEERIAAYRAQEGLPDTNPVPADAVTASGSGLDPHISVRNAELQMPRVAKARDLDPEKVRVLIRAHTEGPISASASGGERAEVEFALDGLQFDGSPGGRLRCLA